MNARHAWATLGAGVLVWEIAAPPGELLSDQAHRWIDDRPVLPRVAIAVICLHLARLLPSRVDPIHALARLIR